MPTDSRPGVEWEEPERLGGGRLDHLAGVDTKAAAHERELVRQGDVDVPEDVFVQLGQLGHFRAGDLDDLADDLPVEERREARAGGCDAPDHLRDVPELEGAVAGIDPLGREGEKEVFPHHAAAPLEEGQKKLLGGAGVGGAFQDHQLAGPEAGRDLGRRRGDEGNIRIL